MTITRRMNAANNQVNAGGNEAALGVRLTKQPDGADSAAETVADNVYWTHVQTLVDWYTDLHAVRYPPYTVAGAAVYSCNCSWSFTYHGQLAIARIFDYVGPDAIVTWDIEEPGGTVVTKTTDDIYYFHDSIGFMFYRENIIVKIPHCWRSSDSKPSVGDEYLITPTVDGKRLNTITLEFEAWP